MRHVFGELAFRASSVRSPYRLEQNCRQQEAAREQLQCSIHSQLHVKGWGLWPSTSLSSRIRRELQDHLSRGQA